jgi:hypothetical protein
MKRLARRVFTLCAALSLLLCVAAGVAWALSYGQNRRDLDRWDVDVRPLGCVARVFDERGVVVVQWLEGTLRADGEAEVPRGVTVGYGFFNYRRRVPFQFIRPTAATPPPAGYSPWARHGTLVFPHWLAVAVLAVPPAAWGAVRLRGRRAARRAAGGLCLACGYDLRASPGRCPECGAVAANG